MTRMTVAMAQRGVGWMQRVTLEIVGMTCAHCKQAVEGALLDIPGVQSASADIARGCVVVDAADSVTQADLDAAVAEAGYERLH